MSLENLQQSNRHRPPRRSPSRLAATLLASLVPLTASTHLVTAASAQPPSEVLTYEQTYDPAGRVQTSTLDSGRVATYTYNEVAGAKTLSYDGRPVVTDVDFDVHGLPIHTERAALGAAPGAVESVSRDDIGRLLSHRLDIDGEASAAFNASGFVYDARGDLTDYARHDAGLNGPQSFVYDGQARLRSWSVGVAAQTYTYDAFGNLTSRSALSTPELAQSALSAIYDTSNRRLGWVYDADGRLERDDRYEYRYDRAGRLAAIFTFDRDLVAHYLYELGGQRVRVYEGTRLTYTQRDFASQVVSERMISTETADVRGEDHLLFAGQAVATVDDETTQLGELVATQRFTDRLGNPVLRWDGDGNRDYQDYAPFGSQVRSGDPQHEGAHGFTGHEDDASGNTYMRARYYDPDASRFQRPDPARDFTLALPSSLNLYQYAMNNPIEYIDPSGLETYSLKLGGKWFSIKISYSIQDEKGRLGELGVQRATFAVEIGGKVESDDLLPVDEVTTPFSTSDDEASAGLMLGTKAGGVGGKVTHRDDGTMKGELGMGPVTVEADDRGSEAPNGASATGTLELKTPMGTAQGALDTGKGASAGAEMQQSGKASAEGRARFTWSQNVWKSPAHRFSPHAGGYVDDSGTEWKLNEKGQRMDRVRKPPEDQ